MITLVIDYYSSLLIDLWIDLSVGVQLKKIAARAPPSLTGRSNQLFSECAGPVIGVHTERPKVRSN